MLSTNNQICSASYLWFELISARRSNPPSSLANQQRRTVFDRLDPGPPRGRGFAANLQRGGPRDQRMIEVEVNPQDVPRGKRYFMVCTYLRLLELSSILASVRLV